MPTLARSSSALADRVAESDGLLVYSTKPHSEWKWMKAQFTIFMDHDGYWLADQSIAAAIIAAPERYRGEAIKLRSKLAACRLALRLSSGAG